MKGISYKSISQKEYWLIHAWLRRNYGSANKCENRCNTKSKVFDWALIHGKMYERNRKNYKMLCKKCHYYYDDLKTLGPYHPMWGRHHTPATRLKMKKSSRHLKPNLGKKASLVTRLKMSKKRKGVPKSPSHRRKIGLSIKAFYKNKNSYPQISPVALKEAVV
jgi:hypothetical protein